MKKILVVLHTLTFTGAPRSAYMMCNILLKHGYKVAVWSYTEGGFSESFLSLGINVKIVPNTEFGSERIRKQIKRFDLVIANTVCTNRTVEAAQDYVPTIWYIREAGIIEELIQNNMNRLEMLKKATNIYTVSEYAKEYIEKNYNSHVKVIHNCIEDNYIKKEIEKDSPIKIVSLGILNRNKGWDTLIDAYKMLEADQKAKVEIHFAGKKSNIEKEYVQRLMEEIAEENGIVYYGELTEYPKVLNLIAQADVVIVPSRDESCSLVVLEGLMMGKPVVVSDHVGAQYLISEENGWIFEKDNAENLSEIMSEFLRNGKEKLAKMGNRSREIYLQTSTVEQYEKNFIQLIKDNTCYIKSIYRLEHMIANKKAERKQRKLKNKKVVNTPPMEITKWGIEKRSKVALYGAGIRGKKAYAEIMKNKDLRIIYWIDKNFEEIHREEKLKIVSPAKINMKKIDYILVAVAAERMFNEIVIELMDLGINREKIVWGYRKK